MATEINTPTEFKEALAKNDHVIVDFYASWCGPCKVMAEQFGPILEKHKNITIIKVNIDEESLESIVEDHNVSSLPNVFYYHKNARVSSFIGNNSAKLWEMAAKSD